MRTEVYLDHARGLVAVAWSTKSGYDIFSEDGSPVRSVYALPAGMTRLQEPTLAPAAPASCATARPLAAVPAPRQAEAKAAQA